ncbi:MAG: hypothetical protein FD126_1087 [Elusimicrobia bacterium]|nr:MAG: hypothetical protein FD126_1087 [Elusimicrobiota bacterium]
MGLFSKSLVRLRIESGFTAPYAFYHRNGGRRVFPFTFAYYLKLERGEHLPRPEWLPILLSLMRIPPSNELYRRFVTDYLRDHFGTEENFQSLVGPLLATKHERRDDQQTAKRLLSEQVYHLTPTQYKAIVSNAATYWAFECLVNDRGSFGPDDLARITGLPKAAFEAALKTLVAQKVARRVSGGNVKALWPASSTWALGISPAWRPTARNSTGILRIWSPVAARSPMCRGSSSAPRRAPSIVASPRCATPLKPPAPIPSTRRPKAAASTSCKSGPEKPWTFRPPLVITPS